MNGLTKLGTVLIVVFLVALLALLVEILYVLWRKRTFRRRSGMEFSGDPAFTTTPSKEQLLYFFCCKNQSRIEPAGNATPVPPPQGPETVVVVDNDDAAKWPLGMYGPSRVLFTIKEEDREETETTSEPENDHQVKIKPVRFEAESESESLSGVVVTLEVADSEGTPFSTPCASPPYYTPSPSPTHDKYFPGNDEQVIVTLKVENDMSSVG